MLYISTIRQLRTILWYYSICSSKMLLSKTGWALSLSLLRRFCHHRCWVLDTAVKALIIRPQIRSIHHGALPLQESSVALKWKQVIEDHDGSKASFQFKPSFNHGFMKSKPWITMIVFFASCHNLEWHPTCCAIREECAIATSVRWKVGSIDLVKRQRTPQFTTIRSSSTIKYGRLLNMDLPWTSMSHVITISQATWEKKR